MQLRPKYTQMCDMWLCELTDELNKLAGYDQSRFLRHYVYAKSEDFEEKELAIRVPGCTVGGIWLDEDNQIIRVLVEGERYPDNINDIMKKYVGETIEVSPLV